MYFVNNFYMLCNFIKWKVNIFNYLTVFYLTMSQEICYILIFCQIIKNTFYLCSLSHCPYLSHVKNPTLNKIIKNGIAENIKLQKYLLATGSLQDSIQQSLDMVVTEVFL